MKIYKLTPKFFKQLRNRIIGFGLLVSIIVIPVSFLVGTRGAISWATLSVIPIIGLAIFFGLFQSLKQQQKIWKSYQLVIDGDTIKKTQDGYQEIAFSRNAISKIVELPNQVINVLATNASLQITIPFTIEEYDEIRAILEGWHPIEVQTKSQNTLVISLLFIIAITILFATTMLATNAYVVTALGSILIVFMIASLIFTQNNPNVPAQTKRLIWFVVLPILSIACRIFAALMGIQR